MHYGTPDEDEMKTAHSLTVAAQKGVTIEKRGNDYAY
jgi:hypothetical protein